MMQYLKTRFPNNILTNLDDKHESSFFNSKKIRIKIYMAELIYSEKMREY